MAVIGTLVCESLAPDADLTTQLTVFRVYRLAAGSPAPSQPSVWTLLDFACPDEAAAAFFAQLAACLLPGPWYVDAHSDTVKYLAFAGKVFAFPRGDHAANLCAVEYARKVGVPETQLDWPR